MAMLGNGTDSERLPYLLDRIKQLEAVVDAAIEREVAATDRANVAEAANRWRKVSEEMPEDREVEFLVGWVGQDWMYKAYIDDDGRFRDCSDYEVLCNPTHWRPLPAPPKED